MTRYGLLRPALKFVGERLTAAVRCGRTIWRQRRIVAGDGIRVASDVACIGEGRFVIGDGTVIRPGVVLKAGRGAVIEIGAHSRVEEGCLLEALAGQLLKLGANFQLGARSVMISVAGIEWGTSCGAGESSQIGPRERGCIGSLMVADGVHFQRGALLDLSADITFAQNVRSGPGCAFYTHNHSPAAQGLIWEQPLRTAPVSVGPGAWIGQNCILLPGVEVGENAVIAAGSVVVRNVESRSVVGGVPAKLIRKIAAPR